MKVFGQYAFAMGKGTLLNRAECITEKLEFAKDSTVWKLHVIALYWMVLYCVV